MNGPMQPQFPMQPAEFQTSPMHTMPSTNDPMQQMQPTQFQNDQSMISPMDSQFQMDQMQPMQMRDMSDDRQSQMEQLLAVDGPHPIPVNIFT